MHQSKAGHGVEVGLSKETVGAKTSHEFAEHVLFTERTYGYLVLVKYSISESGAVDAVSFTVLRVIDNLPR